MWSSLQVSQLCTAAQTMNMTSSGHTARPGGDSHAPHENSITFLGSARSRCRHEKLPLDLKSLKHALQSSGNNTVSRAPCRICTLQQHSCIRLSFALLVFTSRDVLSAKQMHATQRFTPAEQLVQGVIHPGWAKVDDHQVAHRGAAAAAAPAAAVRGPPDQRRGCGLQTVSVPALAAQLAWAPALAKYMNRIRATQVCPSELTSLPSRSHQAGVRIGREARRWRAAHEIQILGLAHAQLA